MCATHCDVLRWNRITIRRTRISILGSESGTQMRSLRGVNVIAAAFRSTYGSSQRSSYTQSTCFPSNAYVDNSALFSWTVSKFAYSWPGLLTSSYRAVALLYHAILICENPATSPVTTWPKQHILGRQERTYKQWMGDRDDRRSSQYLRTRASHSNAFEL